MKSKDWILTLETFNKKVEELRFSSFVTSVLQPNFGFSIKSEPKDDGRIETTSVFIGPSDESIRAFVLTFRLFIHNNETISLGNLASFYDSSKFNEALKQRFNSARNAVNNLLNTTNCINLTINDKTLTNMDILHIFIYGNLAHLTEDKRRRYLEWMALPFTDVMLKMSFCKTLIDILNALIYISKVNEEGINQLRENKPL